MPSIAWTSKPRATSSSVSREDAVSSMSTRYPRELPTSITSWASTEKYGACTHGTASASVFVRPRRSCRPARLGR